MSIVFDMAQKAAEVLLASAAPLLLVLLIVSVLVGLLQSVLQLQDASISFVPKLVALVIAAVVSGGFLLDVWSGLMRETLLVLAGGGG